MLLRSPLSRDVARRHEEHGTAISVKEQAAIGQITEALGGGRDAPA
jgi:hypothetical protein